MVGGKKLHDLTPDAILAWQRRMAKEGGTKAGKPLAPNTIRLARAPLSGAFEARGLARPARHQPGGRRAAASRRPLDSSSLDAGAGTEFLALMEGDRTYPLWAFLLGSGLRIGEVISVRWPNVDLRGRRVRVVEFVSTLGYDLVPSTGKSRDAVRTIDLDDGLVRVLKLQRKLQSEERLAAMSFEEAEHDFTVPGGGPYHPQFAPARALHGRATAVPSTGPGWGLRSNGSGESSDVTLDIVGDPDSASFVQIMKGRGNNPDRVRELMAADSDAWAAFRPEILGSLEVGHPGGAYTMALLSPPKGQRARARRKNCPRTSGHRWRRWLPSRRANPSSSTCGNLATPRA